MEGVSLQNISLGLTSTASLNVALGPTSLRRLTRLLAGRCGLPSEVIVAKYQASLAAITSNSIRIWGVAKELILAHVEAGI